MDRICVRDRERRSRHRDQRRDDSRNHSARDAKALELSIEDTDLVLRGYGRAIVRPRGGCNVVLKMSEAPVRVHVVPNDIQDVPMIVGQPFTDQPDVVVVQRAGEMRLFQCEAADPPELEKLPPQNKEL
ncbi:hypothetical protein QAD02_023378 [Eretmocerus hayati]|uniref:Uncharacterized protein n=1 Tax=Eretmocerus hayati TaxID=131215 RepID=A0ACC2PWC4_9HYME|nr:hypothetical protein QAD02_023378 [Eretmocerus hayati]